MSACHSMVQCMFASTLLSLHSANASMGSDYCIGDTLLFPSAVATPDRDARSVISFGDAPSVGRTVLSHSIFFGINHN